MTSTVEFPAMRKIVASAYLAAAELFTASERRRLVGALKLVDILTVDVAVAVAVADNKHSAHS